MLKPSLLVQGMHGLGDNLHQRAVIRQLMATHDVSLETSWASLYHDLTVDGLKLVRRPVNLRTQSKNANREAKLFIARPQTDAIMRVSYHGANVMKTASKTVLEAMCDVTGTSYATADYSLPIPQRWLDDAEVYLKGWRASGKPLLVYRPLVARHEWRGSVARNADPASYAQLFATIRDEFYVISVADLMPAVEWIVGPVLRADLALHSGELTFEAMAAMFSLADLVFTSSGFAAILGPAVGTPVVSVIGGYENLACHSSGEKFVPMLTLGPVKECNCWTSACRILCNKAVDLPAARPRLREFVSHLLGYEIAQPSTDAVSAMFSLPAPEPAEVVLPPAPPRQSASYLSYLQQVRQIARDQNPEGKA